MSSPPSWASRCVSSRSRFNGFCGDQPEVRGETYGRLRQLSGAGTLPYRRARAGGHGTAHDRLDAEKRLAQAGERKRSSQDTQQRRRLERDRQWLSPYASTGIPQRESGRVRPMDAGAGRTHWACGPSAADAQRYGQGVRHGRAGCRIPPVFRGSLAGRAGGFRGRCSRGDHGRQGPLSLRRRRTR